MSATGFTKIRNGIDEHLRSETISLYEAAVLMQMTRQADYETGLWIGSANRLFTDAPRYNSVRKARAALRHLKCIGWIKGWKKYDGKATTHYVINKFEATSGRHKGEWLNAEKTVNWRKPVFESEWKSTAVRPKSDTTETTTIEKGAPLEDTDLNQDQDKEKLMNERENAPPVSSSFNSLVSPEALSLCTYLQSRLGLKSNPDSWIEPAESLLSQSTPEELRAFIDFAVSDPFWTSRVTGMQALHKFLNSKKERSLMSAFLAAKRAKEVKQKADEPKPKPEKKAGRSKW
jgi:hypothetical protein